MNQRSRIVYVANPYTHADPAVVAFRVEAVRHYTALLTRDGLPAYSPIVHGHDLATRSGVKIPGGWDFWREIDMPFLLAAGALHVLCLPGWALSPGVQEEIATAQGNAIPIRYFVPVATGPTLPPLDFTTEGAVEFVEVQP